jgi:hypothetical protein
MSSLKDTDNKGGEMLALGLERTISGKHEQTEVLNQKLEVSNGNILDLFILTSR